MTNLSSKDRLVYDAIIEYKAAHDGNSPSNRDLVRMAGYKSTSGISAALDRLCEAGLIQLPEPGKTRGIEVVGARWCDPDTYAEVVRAVSAHFKQNPLKMVFDLDDSYVVTLIDKLEREGVL